MEAFKPYTISNKMTLKNRLVMAPMTTYSGNLDLSVSDGELDYYRLRSQTVGMVITAATAINENAQAFDRQMSLKDDRYIPRMKQLSKTIKEHGAIAIVQLHHGGRMNAPHLYKNKEDIVSASAVKAARETALEPRALDVSEIYQIIEDFASATRRTIEAGFDGVELHGANTYLLQQFFSPHSNRRTDAFGGSLKNRMRFITLLIDKVFETIQTYASKPFLLGYRFSPEELEEPGITLEDTKELVKTLTDYPIDYLHISLRDFRQTSQRNPQDTVPIITHIVQTIHNALPLIGVGQIQTHEDILSALGLGCDLVAAGTMMLADPMWGDKVMNLQKPSYLFDKKTLPEAMAQSLMRNVNFYRKRGFDFTA